MQVDNNNSSSSASGGQVSKFKTVSHPLFLHKLSLLRDVRVRPKQFRELIGELTLLVGIIATETLDITTTKQIESPIGPFTGMKLKDSIGIFPIMRAGQGMVDAFTHLLPTARIHHLGLFREKSTLLPVEYYNKLPSVCQIDVGFIVDPMIATAGTAIAAVNILKDWGLKRIIFCSILGSRAGVEALRAEHPEIEIVIGHIDEAELTEAGYIFPGCGDAGDRLFKTGMVDIFFRNHIIEWKRLN